MSNQETPDDRGVLAYYEENCERFIRDTVNVDMRSKYDPFLAMVAEGGHILDAGCGSGRDTRCFLEKGYQVTPFDATPALVAAATDYCGSEVLLMRFQDLAFDAQFDAVWANASLLHVPRKEMVDVVGRLVKALRSGGTLYLSFKVGEGELIERGRFFNNYDEGRLQALFGHFPQLRVQKMWRSPDLRPGREELLWVNALAAKKPA